MQVSGRSAAGGVAGPSTLVSVAALQVLQHCSSHGDMDKQLVNVPGPIIYCGCAELVTCRCRTWQLGPGGVAQTRF